jgi:hypothetical protein
MPSTTMGQIFPQVDDPAVQLAAFTTQQVLLLQAIEHARHRRHAYLADARQRRHRVRPFEPDQHQGFPLHAGELQGLHLCIDTAGKRIHDHLDLPADHAVRAVRGRRDGVDVAMTPGASGHG